MIAEEFKNTIQLIVQNVITSGNLCNYMIGVVESTSPLKIKIEQQEEALTEEFLVLTDAVRDYHVDISVNHTTEPASGGSGYAEFASHSHKYTGKKKITVHNALAVGESVLLVQQQGGQEFIVLSRISDHKKVVGQWG